LANIKYRQASIDDLARLLELEQNIIDYERPFDPFIKESNAKYYDVEKLISASESCLIVAESDSEIIGSGYAQIRPSKSCHTHDNHCYLGFIYLEPEYRGVALGGRMLEDLKDWGLSQGVKNFHLDVYSENKPAIRAYEKMGFKKVTVKMELVV